MRFSALASLIVVWASSALLAGPDGQSAEPEERYDILIRNVLVIDGTGRQAFRADVAVRKRRIAAVGQLTRARAAQVIDGDGYVLSPGFVDLHNHADAIYHTIDDRPGGDVDRVMQHAQTCISSDGSVFGFGSRHPHPRSYGTFPRVLSRYVRERKLLTLEQAVHKMTGLPARRLGWTDRGLIKPGYWADVILFKPEKIRDHATFASPHQYSSGVDYVMVRGEWVLKAGKKTKLRPGRPIQSVPVATTPSTRLRRDLIDLLQAFDGQFGLIARNGTDELVAINASDSFLVKEKTIRQWLADAQETGKRQLVSRQGSSVLVYERFRHNNGQDIVIAVGYDGAAKDRLVEIVKQVKGPIRARLEQQR